MNEAQEESSEWSLVLSLVISGDTSCLKMPCNGQSDYNVCSLTVCVVWEEILEV